MSSHHEHQVLNRKIFTLPFIFLAALVLIAFYILAERMIFGLGAVTNLNDGYPWGIWIVYDVVIGTGFATGGWVLAMVVYIANKGKYHPLVRPALLASLFGYSLGAFSAFIDMGRYWNVYNMVLPGQININSVMLEVGLCVTAYTMILVLEFAPAVLERFKIPRLSQLLDKWLFVIIGIGVLLPTMHQSSIGSLLISAGHKVDPLWQSLSLQPFFALITAIAMGFSIVIFEASMVTVGFKRPSETHLLKGLGRLIIYLLGVYLLVRFGDLVLRGELGRAFAGDLRGNMFLLETLLFVIPLVILLSPGRRSSGAQLLIAAVSLLLAGALYRANAFMIGWHPGGGYIYFPSAKEVLLSLGFVAIEIAGYLAIVKFLPVLPKADHA
ncbi:Ni/Fe-hydrogenase cytochrome b subunit [Aestuariirhabdus sp. Z084]|uniref:Ni/Fe-hydrogenase cytochrome b subunit n=1 Tax=Aestuariirhabdus haliotis TaxID=2918751 RepID=UPI00201B3BD5|nr:Ni/Fe-hydrogenase cytochrome b subunit [Aestuariirhabdus haliotis]MCL6415148.1 Ni/Fe-hydrogenase cytochrome b subunit [Aestuariirhabdus haliotis]MCL6420023.1 Ni/Fe-hydrogenase cytochrome b subunit [Aestuariirhabdus haliotis]